MLNITMLSYNRPFHTRQAVASLYANTLTHFTLTVVDDASKDQETLDTLHELEEEYDFLLVEHTENQGTGRSRNDGIAHSEQTYGRGSYLYLSDNDVYFKKGWWEALEANYPVAHTLGFRILGGYNHPYNQATGSYAGVGVEIKEYDAVGTLSWLLRWDTWDTFGKIVDTHPGLVCQSDDWEWCQRIRKAGFKTGAVWPHVVVNTGFTSSNGKPCVGHEYVSSDEEALVV